MEFTKVVAERYTCNTKKHPEMLPGVFVLGSLSERQPPAPLVE